MHVRPATADDLPEVNKLLASHRMSNVTPNHLNHVALVCEDEGKFAGFVCAGIMPDISLGYADKFVVPPAYRGRGIGKLLIVAMYAALEERGIKDLVGIVCQNSEIVACVLNARKHGVYVSNEAYYLMQKSMENK